MTLLMCVRESGGDMEAEPVLVELAGDDVVLVLDDGDRITLSRDQLAEALEDPDMRINEAA